MPTLPAPKVAPKVEAPKTQTQTARIPAYLGGGEYTAGTGNLVERIKRGYADLEAQTGKQRDHIIPVSLGGTSTRLNLRSEPLEDATAKDNVLRYALKEYQSGKISLPEARSMVINWRDTSIPGQEARNKFNFPKAFVDSAGEQIEGAAKSYVQTQKNILKFIKDLAVGTLRAPGRVLTGSVAETISPGQTITPKNKFTQFLLGKEEVAGPLTQVGQGQKFLNKFAEQMQEGAKQSQAEGKPFKALGQYALEGIARFPLTAPLVVGGLTAADITPVGNAGRVTKPTLTKLVERYGQEAAEKIAREGGEKLAKEALNEAGEVAVRRAGIEVKQTGEQLQRLYGGKSLSPEFNAIERRAFDEIAQNEDRLITEYRQKFGKVVNTDNARELFPEYNLAKTKSAAVHEPASLLAKRIYLDDLLTKKGQGSNRVIFTAGGTGAGKTTAMQKLAGVSRNIERAPVVFDTNLAGLKSSVSKIEAAIKNGYKVEVYYVLRDPLDALEKGALPRAMKTGRVVPLSEHVKTHVDSRQTFLDLARKYEGNNNVRLLVIDNTGQQAKELAGKEALDSVQRTLYNKEAKRKLIKEAYERVNNQYTKAGISEEVARATLGKRPLIGGRPKQAGRLGGRDNRGGAGLLSELSRQARDADQLEAVADKAYQEIVKNGGVTINLKGKQPKTGFPLSATKHAETIVEKEKFTKADMDAFVKKQLSLLKEKDKFIGGWEDEGKIYLDVSKVADDFDSAFKEATEMGEQGVFDLKTGETIYTPNSTKYGEEANVSNINRRKVGTTDSRRGVEGVPKISEVSGKTVDQEAKRATETAQSVSQTRPPTKPVSPGVSKTPQQILQPNEVRDITQDVKKIKAVNTGLNLDKINVSVKGREVLEEALTEVRPQIEEVVGKRLTNKEVQATAEASERILKRVIGREDTLKWESAILKARQKFTAAAESGAIDREALDALLTVKSQGTDIARKLQSLSQMADPVENNATQALIEGILKVTDDIEAVAKEAKGVNFNNFQEASEFYRKFVKPRAEEWLDLLRYNSMLSSPTTHIVNIFSNLVNTALIAPLEKTAAGSIDFFGAALRGKARQTFAGEGKAFIGGYMKNLRNASTRFGEAWRQVRPISQLDIRSIPLATKGPQGAIAKTLSVPMRLLEASDQFFMTLTEGAERAALEYRMARGVHVPLIEKSAKDAALYRVFRQELFKKGQGTALDAIDHFTNLVMMTRRSKNPIVRTIGKFTVPFVQTPMNIFKQGVEYSPLGLLAIPGAKDKNTQLARAIIGSGAAAMAATFLASGRITADEPTSRADKDAFRAAGMQPWSIKLGSRWYSYQKLPPAVAFNLAWVASIDKLLKEKKIDDTTADLIMRSIAKYANFLSDQSYAKSVGDLIDAVKGDEYAIQKLIGNYPQQLIPYRALGGWMARLADDSQRVLDDKAGFIDKQIQLLMLNVPLLSRRLPARVGPTGETIPNQSRLLNALSPIKISPENKDFAEVYAEMEKLRQVIRRQSQESSKRNQEAQQIYNKLKVMTREQANAEANRIKSEDPTLFKAIKKIKEEDELGLTTLDKSMKQLGVENGERAKFIWNVLQKLETPQQKNEYVAELKRKKIITADVMKQLRELKNTNSSN